MIARIYDDAERFNFIYRERTPDGHEGRLKGCSLYVRLIFEFIDRDLIPVLNAALEEKNEIDSWLDEMFNGTTCIDENDTMIDRFRELESLGVINLRVLQGVGKGRFAEMIWARTNGWLIEKGFFPRATIKTVEVQENKRMGSLFLQG